MEEVVLAGYEVIYDEGEGILNVAKRDSSVNKVEDVSNALFMAVLKVDRSREQNNMPPFPDQVKIVGSYHLNDKIIEFAEHRGSKPFSPEEKKMSLQGAIQKYMERGIKEGTIDPKELAVAAERGQPGSVTQALAALPDDINEPVENTQRTPAAPADGQQQQKKPGLLGNTPSPLERFLR